MQRNGQRYQTYQGGKVIPSNYISPLAPYHWLQRGIYDFFKAPKLSLYFGLFFVVALVALLLLAHLTKSILPTFLILPLMVLVGPQIAFCLYDISRQIERGGKPSLLHALRYLRRNQAQQWGFAFVLLFLSLFWTRIASLLYIFYPSHMEPTLTDIAPFLLIGSTFGLLFLVLLFLISVFTLPLLIERRIDLVSAMLTSTNAVLTNKIAMFHWAILIAAAIGLGLLLGLIGLAVTMPIIGFSAWHGYQETILVPGKRVTCSPKEEHFIP